MVEFANSRSVRSKDDLKLSLPQTVHEDSLTKVKYHIDGTQFLESTSSSSSSSSKMEGSNGKSLKAKILRRVFSEDYEREERKILDPRGPGVSRWSKIYLVACIVSLFVDPLFFYLPTVSPNQCIGIGIPLEVVLIIVRSLADIFYMIQIYVRFHTAYVAPSSRVFGRGELVIDFEKIALRYLSKNFWIDFIAALPLPQVLILVVIPSLRGSLMTNTKNVLRFIIIFQYIPRLFLIYPLSSRIVKANGVVTETAWAGAAYNLMLYMLASHVIGACWYLLSIERHEACWKSVCDQEHPSCQNQFFDCKALTHPDRESWYHSSNITTLCNPDNDYYRFGIYGDASRFHVLRAAFLEKYFYCLWWGLRTLSSLGQSLTTSTYIGENVFSVVVVMFGLVLFALLIGNMQTFLQSTTVRLEEWRIRRTDTEQWMRHRQLPPELMQSVRKYDQYKWVATRGVDEESILKDLPMDLRRDIKRHLCLDLVRRVPLFDQMDERMLDAICERLKPALCTEGTVLVREGDPVNEMLFIIRGHLDSHTTNGGRTGFFNSCRLGPGDFCGEELLTWALDPRPSVILPSSTRTVKAITAVEAFALSVEDLKFVASQFRRLHSKQLRHKFRFYSHQWRTWAACFIQAAWRRYKRRKDAADLMIVYKESPKAAEPETTSRSRGLVMFSGRLSTSRRTPINHSATESCRVRSLQKPDEPDFSTVER